jgi:hypothetical protein
VVLRFSKLSSVRSWLGTSPRFDEEQTTA